MPNPLSTKEREKSYAKYFDMPYPAVPSELLAQMCEPMDPSNALNIYHLNDLLEEKDYSSQIGWCVQPDGSGYIASCTKMPNVTLEMLEWWFAWHGLESLRYKIWDPKDHYSACVSKRHLKQRLDTSLTWAQRNWGTTDFVVENVGDGASALRIAFRSPSDFGFDMERFHCQPVTAICAHSGPPDTDISRTTFVHFAREYDGGIELQSRFWLGYMMMDKKPVRTDFAVDPSRVKGLANHCPQEYHRLAKYLPQLFAENAHIVQSEEDFVAMDFSK